MPPQPDYDALAQKYGAIQEPDYDALAQRHGGTVAEPSVESPIPPPEIKLAKQPMSQSPLGRIDSSDPDQPKFAGMHGGSYDIFPRVNGRIADSNSPEMGAAALGGAVGVGADLAAPVAVPAARMAGKVIQKHPFATMLGIEGAKRLPVVGPMLDKLPGLEYLPFLAGHGEAPGVGRIRNIGEAAAESAEAEAASKAPAVEPSAPTQFEQPPVSPVTRKQVGAAVDKSFGVEPLKPNVRLRDQVPAKAAPKAEPVSEKKVESSVIHSHDYDPAAKELHVVTKSNPNTAYVYGDVSPEQAQAFESATSKGKAWAEFKKGGSPLVAKIVNGNRVPVRPVIAAKDLNPEGAGPKVQVKATTRPGRAQVPTEDDLVPLLKKSVKQARAKRSTAAD
jgi:hypothetical protein